MRSMRGECTGNVRSTPTPYDVLRTVNVSRLPAPLRPMTVPSKTWMRSLSPSTTRTCTRTVSPGLKAGTPLRSCSASMRSIGFMALHPRLAEPYLLTVRAQPVKDDGCRAPHREMVPAVRAADRLEEIVHSIQDLGGQTPSRPEDDELGARFLAQPPAQVGERQPATALPRACRHQPRHHALLALDVGDDRVEVVREARERERFLARVVVCRTRTGVPVTHDALD